MKDLLLVGGEAMSSLGSRIVLLSWQGRREGGGGGGGSGSHGQYNNIWSTKRGMTRCLKYSDAMTKRAIPLVAKFRPRQAPPPCSPPGPGPSP